MQRMKNTDNGMQSTSNNLSSNVHKYMHAI